MGLLEVQELQKYWGYSSDLFSEYINDVVRQASNQQDMLNDLTQRLLDAEASSRVSH